MPSICYNKIGSRNERRNYERPIEKVKCLPTRPLQDLGRKTLGATLLRLRQADRLLEGPVRLSVVTGRPFGTTSEMLSRDASMSWLKAYQKEHNRWPVEQKIRLGSTMTRLVTEALAKHYGLRVRVEMTNRSSGHAWSHTIALPYKGARLGMIYHEIAHVYCNQKYQERCGHTGKFWNALGVIYSQGKFLIKDILLKAKADAKLESQAMIEAQQRVIAKTLKAADRKNEAKILKATSEYKIAKVQAKIKKLESRAKCINTKLKSYRRSLVHLQRYQSIKRQEIAPVIEAQAVNVPH